MQLLTVTVLLPRLLVSVLLVGGLVAGTGIVAEHGPASATGRTPGTATPVGTSLADDSDTGSIPSADVSTLSPRDLAPVTDLPMTAPPRAVRRHNRNALASFPATSRDTSIHPRGVELHQGTFLRDAYLTIFAVAPSTRAHLSPGRQRLYVGPTGTAMATLDYRVELPSDDTHGALRTYWRLQDHAIVSVRLLVNGTLERTTNGSHTPTVQYDGLSTYPGTVHNISLAATVRATVRKRVVRCSDGPNQTPDGNSNRTVVRATETHLDEGKQCTEWITRTSIRTETLTVRDERHVVAYDPTIRGYRGRYPSGDQSVVLRASQPIAGVTVGATTVRSTWRYFLTRADRWSSLVVDRRSARRTASLGPQPLRVHAYPSTVGPTASSQRATIDDVFGPVLEPPQLPANVELEVPAEPYTATSGLSIRVPGACAPASSDAASPSTRCDPSITTIGLVAGVAIPSSDPLEEVAVVRSALRLTVENVTERAVRLHVTLTAARTGTPIDTANRSGIVRIAGRQVNTAADGTASVLVKRSRGPITATYEPARFGGERPAYVGASDTVSVPGSVVHLGRIVLQALVLVGSFLLAVFLIDRTTGWELWPLWRGYR